MGQYLPIFALLVLAMLFGAGSFVASKLLAPQQPTATKLGPYECGIVPGREPPQRFSVRFYLVAMIFIVFDIEIIFLFPYATVVNQVGTFGFVAVLIFSVALFESFLYLLGSGALEWGPVVRRVAPGLVTPERTTSTTVRRVGDAGRVPVTAGAGNQGAAA
jgi:NADH-quinone oxidoreductase subunit A